MAVYNTKKDIIFYVPGNTGKVYSRPANHYISSEYLVKKQEKLIRKKGHPVIYVEDRRNSKRPV